MHPGKQLNIKLSTHQLVEEEEEVNDSYICENARRDEELLNYVDDFILSKEYALLESLKIRQKVSTSPTSCICIKCEDSVSKIDLVKMYRDIWVRRFKSENILNKRNVKAIREKQEKSIKIIKDKILETRNQTVCHFKERRMIIDYYRQQIVDNFPCLHSVDKNLLTPKSKVYCKVLAYYKVRQTLRKRQKQRMIGIIQKIVNEYLRQRKIDAFNKKQSQTEVIQKKKKTPNLSVIGTMIELVPPPESLEESVTEEEKEELIISAELEDKKIEKKVKKQQKSKTKKSKTKSKSDKKVKKNKKDKKGKKDKKSKKSKKSKKQKPAEPEDLLLPCAPQNKRLKIEPEDGLNADDFKNDLRVLDYIEEEKTKFEYEKEYQNKLSFADEPWFFSQPEMIVFNGFQNRMVYKKVIKILNGGTTFKRCRFHKVQLDEFNPGKIEVQPVGVQALLPGKSFSITITFLPESLQCPISGNIVFLTYSSFNTEYLQFRLSLTCTPLCVNVKLSSDTVIFDPIPIWTAKAMSKYKNFKTLKITNVNKLPCKIVISKIKDSISSEDTSLQSNNSTTECDEIMLVENQDLSAAETDPFFKKFISDSTDYIFSEFTFSTYWLSMEGNSHKYVKIYFRNVDHVGYYNEKYLLKVFEETESNTMGCIGNQYQNKNQYHLLAIWCYIKQNSYLMKCPQQLQKAQDINCAIVILEPSCSITSVIPQHQYNY